MHPQNAKARPIEKFGLAIASLVAGICASGNTFPSTVRPLPLVCAVLAIAFGLVALNLVGRNPGRFGGTRIAITGILVGMSALVVFTSRPPGQDFRRARCMVNLETLYAILKIYSKEHSGMLPDRLQLPTNLHYNPSGLHCPLGMSSQQHGINDINASDLEMSYAYLVSGWQMSELERHPQQLMLFCPLHKHGLLADGSVQKIDKARALEAGVKSTNNNGATIVK